MKKISIISATLNAEHLITYFLDELQKQTYPKNLIEIVVADGGSTDKTIEIATKYGAKIVPNKYILGEPGVHVGMQASTGDLCMIMAVDNFFKEKNAIATIAKIFDDFEILAAFPKHDSKPEYSLFSKYNNTFTDPFNNYMFGDAGNARTFHRVYKTLEHNDVFDIYDYTSNPAEPMLAMAQGFTVRREFVKKRTNPYDDMIPVIQAVKAGKKIAYVHSVSCYHPTIKDLNQFIRKQRWSTRNALSGKSYGIAERSRKFPLSRKLKMYFYPLYAFSIVLPIFDAVKGFVRDQNPIWFFHPVVTVLTAGVIVGEWVRKNLHSYQLEVKQPINGKQKF